MRFTYTRRRAGVAAALLLTGSVAGWTAGGAWTSNAATVAAGGAVPTVERTADGAIASYATIVDRVAPAVVTIRSQGIVRTAAQPEFDNPLFRKFFGDPGQRRMPERRTG